MEQPKECVTVVVPVYNRPGLLPRSLEGIKAQVWRPLKVLVVDNGSTDNTLDVARRWAADNSTADFQVDVLQDNRRGAAYARQTGLEHADTDKIFFFDSDDVSRSNCVSSAMEQWRLHPDAMLVAWPILRHGKDGDQQTHSITGNLLERHLVHAILQTQGYAVKTEYLRSVGGWRGEYPNWNDFETGVRILLRNPKVISIDKPLADVYPQVESITGTSYSAKTGKWEKSLDGVEKTIRESGRKDMLRLLNIVSYRRAILAADYAKEGRLDLAKPLYRQALREVPAKKRPLIRFAYHWTRLRMRGAFSIIGRFL